MNIFSRVLLAIYAFCLALFSAMVMLIAIKPVIFKIIYDFLDEKVISHPSALVLMFIIALVLFVLSFTFLFSGLKSGRDKKAVSKHTNIGEIKISLNSIENISLNASRKVTGIRETRASVRKMDQNVSITIRAVVMPDVNIPALSEDIQSRVKRSVEESSGVMVNDVRVIVDNIYSGAIYRARVE
jgi:uncharacterized alkaline shock family protein YloU